MSRLVAFIGCFLALSLCFVPAARTQGAPQKSEAFDFGTIGVSDELQHTFEFTNSGSRPLEIENVQLTPPLLVTQMPSRIAPGEKAGVTVRMETPREKGEFRGSVVVNFRDPAAAQRVFWMVGRVVPPIEFDPFPIFFISTLRGQEKTASIEIVNHETDPFDIENVENPCSRATTKLETLEPGRRYRLSLTMTGTGAAGRTADVVTLTTSSRANPFLRIRANTNLNERVHVFPDVIDLGTISGRALKANQAQLDELTQRVMIYQEGGAAFQISAASDVPFLSVATSQAQLKDRFEVRLSVVPEKLKSGAVRGRLVINTNDSEFPQVTIPVTGVVEDDWN
jgi:hypothetical protein